MKIGLSYDLRTDYLAEGFTEEETAEFDGADTIEAIEHTLEDLGFETARIGNIRNLARRLLAGDRWDMVFNIAEGLRGFGREAQVPAILDAYDVPYTFSDPLVLSLTLHKGMSKRVIRDMGLPTPNFFVVERVSDLERVALPFPLFAKPVAEGTGKGINGASKIATRDELLSVCERLLQTYNQAALVEIFLPGREFTVGIIGTGEDAMAIGALEVILKKDAEPYAHSYRNKKRCEDLVEYHLAKDTVAEEAEELALTVWRGLGCRDGGRVDLRVDEDGTPNIMEVNPLAGLHPEHSDLCILARQAGITYKSLIGAIMSSAIKRYPSTSRGI
ncbi:MAG: D-alanine--D-alanine ligase [Deltaproteobacteria bacterium]|nr:D-alanine--D-alanine ligase [Deltaproteobacteria bacterium]